MTDRDLPRHIFAALDFFVAGVNVTLAFMNFGRPRMTAICAVVAVFCIVAGILAGFT